MPIPLNASSSFDFLPMTSDSNSSSEGVNRLPKVPYRSHVCGLFASTRYTFHVGASVVGQFPVFDGTLATVDDVWTELSDRPLAPLVVSTGSWLAIVQLTSLGIGRFDVSSYFLVVSEVNSSVDVTTFHPPINASTMLPVPRWTSQWYSTIELSANELNDTTTVMIGDGKVSGTSMSVNQPLLPDTLYALVLVSAIRMPDNQSVMSFSWPPTLIRTASDTNRSTTLDSSTVFAIEVHTAGSENWCSNCEVTTASTGTVDDEFSLPSATVNTFTGTVPYTS